MTKFSLIRPGSVRRLTELWIQNPNRYKRSLPILDQTITTLGMRIDTKYSIHIIKEPELKILLFWENEGGVWPLLGGIWFENIGPVKI